MPFTIDGEDHDTITADELMITTPRFNGTPGTGFGGTNFTIY